MGICISKMILCLRKGTEMIKCVELKNYKIPPNESPLVTIENVLGLFQFPKYFDKSIQKKNMKINQGR